MDSGQIAAWASTLAAGASAFAAWLSWRSEKEAARLQSALSVEAVKAAAFEPRFAVYSDVLSFMQAWSGKGRPDLQNLPILISAWDRSRYLFASEVTQLIREIWLDAVRVDYAAKVIEGAADGDRHEAIRTQYDRLNFYFGADANAPYSDVMYKAFAKDLSLHPPLAPIKIQQ